MGSERRSGHGAGTQGLIGKSRSGRWRIRSGTRWKRPTTGGTLFERRRRVMQAWADYVTGDDDGR